MWAILIENVMRKRRKLPFGPEKDPNTPFYSPKSIAYLYTCQFRATCTVTPVLVMKIPEFTVSH